MGERFHAVAAAADPAGDDGYLVRGLDPDGLHRRALRRTEAAGGLCAALTPTDKGCGCCIARRAAAVRPPARALHAASPGPGRGPPGRVHGSRPLAHDAVPPSHTAPAPPAEPM